MPRSRPRPRRASAGPAPPSELSRLDRYGPLILVLVTMAVVALVRLRIAEVPLERDEGEYAYAGQLILQGVPPYELAYNMKFPGTYYAYALVLAVFGQSAWGIHVGLLALNAVTTIVLFAIGRRLLGPWPGAAAAGLFAILALDRGTLGPWAHATQFVLLPMLGGLALVLRAGGQGGRATLAASGALFGLAVLMKQQAILYLPFALGLAAWLARREAGAHLRTAATRAGILAAGALAPFVALCALFALQGVLGRFYYWTFQYASEYVAQVRLDEGWLGLSLAWGVVTRHTLVIWLAGAGGLAALWLASWPAVTRVVVTGLALFSALAVSPGFYFREHYFVLLLPAVAFAAAGLVATIARGVAGRRRQHVVPAITVMGFLALAALYAVPERAYLFSLSPRDLSRAVYGPNPFIEAVDIARYMADRTSPDDRIAVLGSEPEIYFYAGRRSATGHIYTYALMELQPFAAAMQDEMRREIEAAHPAYLVIVPMHTSWLFRPGSHRDILTWAQAYADTCYDLVGLTDIHAADRTTMLWDEAVAGYQPRSENLVFTFRRKGDTPCAAAR